jgi:hypothetical protein
VSAFHISNEVTINHRELGAEVWEWDAGEQATFLVGFAETFRANAGHGIFQIHYIADELHTKGGDLEAVRWLNDRLTEYLEEENA